MATAMPKEAVNGTEESEPPRKKFLKWTTIPKPETAIMVCVSSRALFDMSEKTKIYEEQGLKAYTDHMIQHEDEPLKPGSALPFVKALNSVNMRLLEMNPDENNLFDVVLMSKNSAQIGVSLINSIKHHDLTVDRMCLTDGNSVTGYLNAYNTDLYLSVDPSCVRDALKDGIASAVVSPVSSTDSRSRQLRVAFDGDAVLFSDEAEKVTNEHGLSKIIENESELADKPLEVGPLHKFAMILRKLKKKFHDKGIIEDCPIRTYLVTARGATSSGERCLKTLREWGLDVDEAIFLAGAPKGPILKKIQPHIFFDDQQKHVECGQAHGVPSAHVPYGISQTHQSSKKTPKK